MEDVKLDPKAKWRAKNRERLNEYQRQYWRKKQAEKACGGTEKKHYQDQDVLTGQRLKNYHDLVLSNFGLTAKSCREISQKYLIANS